MEQKDTTQRNSIGSYKGLFVIPLLVVGYFVIDAIIFMNDIGFERFPPEFYIILTPGVLILILLILLMFKKEKNLKID